MRFLLRVLFVFSLLVFNQVEAQIVSSFTARYQNNQKGGIVFLSNVSVTCNSGTTCTTAKAETPPSGSYSNGSFTMSYIDIDSDASTFMSSSDSLKLSNCSEILWAGLYWSGRINTSTTNYSSRSNIKVKVNSGSYQTLTADNTLDVPTINGSSWTHPSYYCYKNITSLVTSAGIKARFTVADLVTQTGSTNLWGGWSIVVVYKNIYESMRNLTVFDGFANVAIGNTLDIPISGFVTPPSGPVSFELGVIALDGDRDSNGDQLQFKGASSFVNVSDGLHNSTNFFNSSISYLGALTPYRNPSYNNTLGYDASIFSPTNTSLNYIGNNATSATVRVSTTSENILTRVITSAIDVYEPDLRANVRISDLNGGLVNPGDILEYTLVGKNIGSDNSMLTYITDTLDPRTTYVPNSMSITYGPNLGAKTDATGDDQAEYNSANKTIKVRIGTGANATTGGEVVNSATGADSTVIKFKVTVVDNCTMFLCDNTLDHKAYIFGQGDISGNAYNNDGASDTYDSNGCPLTASNTLTINVSTCAPPVLSSNGPLCAGSTLNLTAQYSGSANYSWSGPNGFTSTSQNPSITNVTSAASGTYTLSYTYTGLSCSVGVSTNVTINANPTVQTSAYTNPSCYNGANGTASITPSGSSPFTYAWSTGGTTNSISGLAAGTYTVTVTDAHSCSLTQNYTLTQPLQLTATASATTNFNGYNISCYQGSNGAATVAISGGTSPYSVSWSNGSTSTSISGLTAATYTVTVTDSKGCTATSSVTLTQPTAITLTMSNQTNVNCYGGSTGALDLTATGGVAAYAYAWSNSSTTQDLNTLTAGTYSVTITDANSCTKTGSYTITQPSAALASSETHTHVNCYGNATGAIDLSVSGGTTAYAYAWSNGATTQDLTAIVAGTYTVTITDAKGCTNSKSITITQPTAALAVTGTTTAVNCFGGNNGAINITVSGGTTAYSYAWSNASSQEDLTNLSAGTYTVTITDANNCTTSGSYTITQPASSIQFSTAQTNVSCNGGNNGSISLSPLGGTAPFTYTWNTGATTASLQNLIAGTYTINAHDVNNCSYSNTFTITQPTALSQTGTASFIPCYGGTNGNININVIGGTTPYSYSWSNGATTEDISNLSAGNFAVTITDFKGCTTSGSYTVSQTPDAVSIALTGSDILCHGNLSGSVDASVSGGTTPYTFSWSNGATTEDVTLLAAGQYTLHVSDVYGCSAHDSITLTQPAAVLSFSGNTTPVLCYGDATGGIDVNVAGGTIPYVYTWSNGATTQDLAGISTGSYQLTVTDNHACTHDTTFTISQPLAPLQLTTTSDSVTCFGGNTGAIDLSVTGGTFSYTYTWSNGSTSEDQSGLSIGNYTVNVVDANGCSASTATQIYEPTALTISSQITSVKCFGDASGSIDVTLAGGITPYAFAWSNGATTEDISGLVAGTYSLVASDANHCSQTVNFAVTQPSQALTANESHTNVLCYGGSSGAIDVSTTGGTSPYIFSWNTGATTEDISGLTAGNYSLSIVDSNACSTSVSVILTQPSAPIQLTSTPSNVNCFGQSTGAIDLSVAGGSSPYQYQWSNGATTEDVVGLAAGTYTVTVSDAQSCSNTTTFIVNQPALPLSITEAHQDAICISTFSGSIDLTVSGGTAPYLYTWNNGQTTQDINSLGQGIYSVNVTDALACENTVSIQISDPTNLMQLSETHTNVSCFGGANGTIDLSVTNGNPVGSYVWNSGAATQDINGLAAGNYFVNVYDINGCVSFLSAQIAQPLAPVSASAVVTNALCFGQSTGAINLTASGGTAPYTYNWDTGATTEDIGNLAAGDYTVIIHDSLGCLYSYTDTVKQANSLISITANQVQVSCFGGSNGQIDLTVSGGQMPYVFNWSNGTTTEDANALLAGNYSVNVTDANGCSQSLNFAITQPTSGIQASISPQAVSCFSGSDGSIQLNVSGGTPTYSYAWNNGATIEDISGLPAGQYSVVITDANGCQKVVNAQILQPNSALTLSISSTPALCHNGASGTANVTISGGNPSYQITWNNGEITPQIDSLIAGNYSVVVQDAGGCSISGNVQVSQPTPIVATTNSIDVKCYGQSSGSISSSVSGGIAPYSLHWSTGSSNSSIQNLPAGPFFLDVTDANGCTTTFSDTIYQPASPLDNNVVITDNICFGENQGSIDNTVNGGTAPYQYLWNTAATTEDLINLLAGTYTITVLDANNCLLTENITVGQPLSGLLPNAQVTDVLCYGDSTGTIDLTITGPDGPFSFLWSNGATTEDITQLSAGIYTVQISNTRGCLVSASYTVNQPLNGLVYSSVITDVSCKGGSDGAIDISVSGGAGSYTYSWSNLSGNADQFNLLSGVYTVTITDANGCQQIQNETVQEPITAVQATLLSSDVACKGQSTGAIDISVSGGSPGYTYLWSNGAISQDLTGIPAGYYNLLITDAHLCTINIDTTIFEPDSALVLNAAIQNINCIGSTSGSISVFPEGGTPIYAYSWSTGATSASISNLGAGVYTIQLSDSLGCTINQSFTLTQPSTPLAANGTITDVACHGGLSGAIQVTTNGGTAPYFYLWSNGHAQEDLANISVGTYTLTITDAGGCSITQSYTVTEPTAVQLTNTVYPVSCFGGTNGLIDISISGGTGNYMYLWSNNASTEDIGNLLAGNYFVNVTDGNGCLLSQSFVVNQPAFPTSLSAVVSNAPCFNAPGGSIDLTVTSANPGFTYSWNNGATTEDIQNLVTGTYSVSVADSNGCTNQASFVVGQATAISITAALLNDSCFGGANGAIDVSVNGGTPNYSYAWNTGATTQDISNLLAGTYFLQITDSSGCTKTASYTILQPVDSLQLTGIINDGTTCAGFSDAHVDISVSGGTGAYTYNWSNGAVTQDLINVLAGTYTVSISDQNHCSLSRTIVVTEPLPLGSSFTQTNIACFSDSTGAINLEVTGGIEDYGYLWTNGATTQDIDSLSANTYHVIITDANGCVLNDSVTIVQPANALAIQLTAQNVNCYGLSTGAVDLSIQGGVSPYTFNWSNGQITEDLSAIPAGTYTVSVADSNGCVVSGSINVVQPASPLSVNATLGNVSCYQGSDGFADITIQGGSVPYLYQWSNGATSQDIINVQQGSYSVTITDNNNCSIQASYVITQPASGMVLSGSVQDVTCFAGTNGAVDISVNGGYPPYSYNWSNNTSSEDVSSLSAGQYIVQVGDTSGCIVSDTFQVNQPLTPISINVAITTVACFGDATGAINLTTSGGSPGYTFNWSNAAITEDIQSLPTGNYTIHITDQHGCTLDSTINVGQPANPLTLTETHQNVACHGNPSGSINLNVTGGTTPYTYSWSNGATTQDISTLLAGNYSVQVTDGNLCTQSLSISVTQPALALTASETHQNIICYGASTGSIDLTPAGGTAPYTYAWNTGATTQDIANLTAGTYLVSIKDANLCTYPLQITITQPSNPVTIAANVTNIACYGNASGTIDVTVTGGSAPYTYSWNGGASTTQDLYNVVSGTYYIVVTDAVGCSSSASYSVVQPSAALNASYVTSPVSCYGGANGSVTLSISGGTVPYAIQWANGATAAFQNGLPAGNYPIQITDAAGCTFNLVAVVTQPQPLVSNFTFDATSGCSPLTINFTSTSQGTPTACVWDFGNGQTSNECGTTSYTYDTPGCYTVSLTINSGTGCSSIHTVDSAICVLPTPTAAFSYVTSPDVYYSGEVSFNNLSSAAETYTWIFGDLSPNSTDENVDHSYPHFADTTYDVMLIAKDSNGCVDTVINKVTIGADFNIYVPNAFTIDDNEYNETFIPVFSDYTRVKKYHLYIYDRWGELIWETTDYTQSWDGRANGKDVQDGVYTWKLNYELYNDGNRTLVGHVSLLR